MPRRPTISDLAAAAGVSLATVDRVLNARQPVRAATAVRVLEAAQQIGFHSTALIRHRVVQALPEIAVGVLLQHPETQFYQRFRAEMEAAAVAAVGARVRLTLDHLPSQAPVEVAQRMEAMGAWTQAVALMAIDHPAVTEAAAALRSRGVPVVALLSDFAQGVRAGFVGVDNLRAGRTAAWMIAHGMAVRYGDRDASGPARTEAATLTDAAQGSDRQIALFVAGHRWHAHALRETGFRSFFRSAMPGVEVLDTLVNLETAELTYEAALGLLARRPGLAGFYGAGGGMEGVLEAIREEGRGRRIGVVMHEATDAARRGLTDGLISLVIGTPLPRVCAEVMALIIRAVTEGASGPAAQVLLPMDLHLPESL